MSLTRAPRTVVDVLDEFFEGEGWGYRTPEHLNKADLDQLAETIDDFYCNYIPPAVGGHIRQYSGGATFAQPERNGWRSDIALLARFSPSSLLYADEVVIHCPLDDWITPVRGSFRVPGPTTSRSGVILTPLQSAEKNTPGYWSSDVSENRTQISSALDILSRMETGIRSGWVIPIPHLRFWKKREQDIWSQVSKDMRSDEFLALMEREWHMPPATADNIRGLRIDPPGGYSPEQWRHALTEGPSAYFNGTLAVADFAEARFLSTADSDYALLLRTVNKALQLNRQLRDALLIGSMQNVLAPTLEDDKIESVFEIRADTAAFASWRSGLTELVCGQLIPSNIEMSEGEEIVRERLEFLIAQIRLEIRNSASLSSRFGAMEGLDIGVAALLFHLTSDLLTTIIGSLPAIIRAAVKAIRPDVGHRASVLMQLEKAEIISNKL